MKIDKIENGYVLDHISAGCGMKVYEALGLANQKCQVAIIQNAKSEKLGVKDIIKVNELINLDLDVLAFIDKNITVNIIKDGIASKKNANAAKTDRECGKMPESTLYFQCGGGCELRVRPYG